MLLCDLPRDPFAVRAQISAERCVDGVADIRPTRQSMKRALGLPPSMDHPAGTIRVIVAGINLY